MKLILICLLLTGANAFAQESIFSPHRSHWTVTLNGEQVRYKVPYNFEGNHRSFGPLGRTLTGGRLGLGREFNLFGGLKTTSKVEGYYMGTLFAQSQTAKPNADIELGSFKRVGQIYGWDVGQSLSYVFEFSMRHIFMGEMTYMRIEPFIEAGLGQGWAFNKLTYFDDRDGVASRDAYEHRFEDKLMNSRIGAGFLITSVQNYYLFVRGTLNRYDVTRRRSYRKQTLAGSETVDPPVTLTDAEMDPVMVYAIGGGYKF